MNAIEAVIAKRRAEAAAGQVAQTSGTWRIFAAHLHGLCVSRRKALGLSQDAAAEKIGVGRATLQRWESSRSAPGVDNLFKWADGLGIEISATVRACSINSDAEEAA